MTKNQLKTPLLIGDGSSNECEAKRAELKAYFLNSWQSYESLFSLINNGDAFYSRPEALRHPLIFYYGHTATFYINKLMLGKFITSRVNEKLEAICAVGVDEMSWDDLNSAHYEWPSVEEVLEYRQQVSKLICQLIDQMPLSLPITQDSLAWIILMGCEHERIHLETSSVIMRMLPLSDLSASDLTLQERWASCPYYGEAPINSLLEVPTQHVTLGKPSDDHTFGWDNEYGNAHVEVDTFNVSKYLVSNQEFMAFVEADGYHSPQYWSEEGQQWLSYKKATMPHFWLKKSDGYYQRNLIDEIPLPLNWPVEVNYLEAKAFCNWKTTLNQGNYKECEGDSNEANRYTRMPTEAEWQILRNKLPLDLVDWQEAPGNLNLEYFASSCPVDRFSHEGIFDITGNVWQWTESPIDAFDGFEVHPLYDDFSTPTFDGLHNLIKGGSWISTGNEAIKSSRYAFRRHFFQHAGFRYVESKDAEVPVIKVNRFENNADVCQQLTSHYGQINNSHVARVLKLDNYQVQLAHSIKAIVRQYHVAPTKLLDLGCSVGRCSFELAPIFEHIDGVDFSARYIQHGVQLQSGERVRFESIIEGDIVDFNEVHLSQLNIEKAENILFSQGDPCNLKSIFTGYDMILAQQVLTHSYDPKMALTGLESRLNDDGILVLVSDYQFSEQHTNKGKWLGGVKVNGENVIGFDGVYEILNRHFELLKTEELIQPLMNSQRNLVLNNQQLSVWRKR